MKTHKNAAVTKFFLYGEPPRAERGHFLHLESLDTRSRPNDWNIRPHAHANLSHVFFIQEGGGEMLVEQGRQAFRAPVILIIPARTIHAFHWEPESAGWVLTLSDTHLDDMFAREADFQTLFEIPGHFEFDRGGSEMALFEFELARLSHELNWVAPGHVTAVQAHLQAVLIEAMRLMLSERGGNKIAPGPYVEIVARFRAAIEDDFRHNLPLNTYAEKLGVSLTQLRAACIKVAEQPPARLIQERRVLEARRLLLYSNVTIAETAYHLGYDDPAYFSRVFTRNVGQSPRMFRKRHPIIAS